MLATDSFQASDHGRAQVAITPPSDIVLGVALAADPQTYQAAAQRLTQLSAARTADFAALISDAIQSAEATTATGDAAVPGGSDLAPAPGTVPPRTRQSRTATDAFGQLEAFVLQTFIQSMLPKNAPAVFGKGTAGEVWKSMLAEKMGAELAKSGQIGIAKRLAAAHASVTGAGPALGPLAQAPVVANAALSSLSGNAMRAPAALSSMLPYLQQRLTDPDAPSSVRQPDPAERS